MCGYGECLPEHSEYINHLMACEYCYAPSNSYCSEGNRLHMESDAAFIVGLEDLHDRRRWMVTLAREWTDRMPLIELLVKEKYEVKRKALNQVEG